MTVVSSAARILPASASGVQSPTAEVTASHDAVNVAGAYCCGVVAEADAAKPKSRAIEMRDKTFHLASSLGLWCMEFSRQGLSDCRGAFI